MRELGHPAKPIPHNVQNLDETVIINEDPVGGYHMLTGVGYPKEEEYHTTWVAKRKQGKNL